MNQNGQDNRKKMTAYASEDVGKENILPFLVTVQICTVTMKINVNVPQESGNKSSSRLSYSYIIIWHILKDSRSYYRDTCSTMFNAAVYNSLIVETDQILINE